MTKLEYWKSVENDDFIKACKDAGINLVSTNVSDARKEFMTMDFSAKYPNLSWRDLTDKLSNLFLVGLKLKSLTSYEYGKMFTLSARLDEESTWDRLPYNVSYEDNVNFSNSNKLDSYIIEGCKLILRSVSLSSLKSAISRHERYYGELDKNDETSWAGLICSLFRDEDGSFEADSYIMGKTYEVLKAKGLENEFIANILCELIYEINYYETNAGRDEYDDSLRPYILNEDPKYVDSACGGVNEYSTLPKFIIKATSPIRTENELEKLLDDILEDDQDDYEDEFEDDEYDEESEYDIEMKAAKDIDEMQLKLNQPVKSKVEHISSSSISVEQIVKNPLTGIEIPDYNGLTIVSELVKVADSDSLKESEMSGLFTIKSDKGSFRILVDNNGGIYLEKSTLDKLDKEYIKDILIRFTTPNGSYSEDLEFFNKWNEVAGFLKLTNF